MYIYVYDAPGVLRVYMHTYKHGVCTYIPFGFWNRPDAYCIRRVRMNIQTHA